MVRHYPPHTHADSIKANTNYAPQADNEGSIPGQNEMDFNVTSFQMLFNVTGEEMEYN